MKDAGRRVGGKDLQSSLAQGFHDRLVALEADDVLGRQLFLQETFHIVSRQDADLVGGQVLHLFDGGKVLMDEELGVGLGQGGAVFKKLGPFLIEEESGVGVGPAVPHHAQGLFPGRRLEIDGDARPLGPQAPHVDDQSVRLAVLVLKMELHAVGAVGDGDSFRLARRRGNGCKVRRAPCQDDG